MEKITLGDSQFEACKLDMYGAALMIIKAPKGFLACGYVKIETAEKLGQAGAIVTGVKNYDDMLGAKVSALSSQAESLGVKLGMSGAQALEYFR